MDTHAPLFITDLDRCTPPNHMSREPKLRHWRTIAYETDTLTGVMLIAGPETLAPPLTCRLDLNGWYRISFGVYSDYSFSVEFLARMSSDATFSMLEMPPLVAEREADGRLTTPAYRTKRIDELFWKVADLTDQSIVLGQISKHNNSGHGPGSWTSSPARIAYIRLDPVSDSQVTALKADRSRKDTQILFAHDDAHGPHHFYRPVTAEELRRHVEALGDSDFGRLYWEAGGGDELNYFTQLGRMTTRDGVEDFPDPGYRHQAESWRIFREKNIDPFKVIVDYAHELGLELHAGYRVGGFHYPPPSDHFNDGDTFFKRHPELRGMDRTGKVTPRISYVYEKTRQFVISVLEEIVSYEVDGIALLYNRRPPLVDYERPLIEGFKAEYGIDPTLIPEDDECWLSYRSRTLTQFMREVRKALDRISPKRHIEVTAVVAASKEENLSHAMDVEAWVAEDLVDVLSPYSSLPALDSLNEAWANPSDIDWWITLTKGSICKLAPNVMPRHFPPEDYYRKAQSLYERGVEHLFLWDTDVRRVKYRPSWNALRRLGHKDEIAEWTASGEPNLTVPHKKITKLGDWDLSYITPG